MDVANRIHFNLDWTLCVWRSRVMSNVTCPPIFLTNSFFYLWRAEMFINLRRFRFAIRLSNNFCSTTAKRKCVQWVAIHIIDELWCNLGIWCWSFLNYSLNHILWNIVQLKWFIKRNCILALRPITILICSCF